MFCAFGWLDQLLTWALFFALGFGFNWYRLRAQRHATACRALLFILWKVQQRGTWLSPWDLAVMDQAGVAFRKAKP